MKFWFRNVAEIIQHVYILNETLGSSFTLDPSELLATDYYFFDFFFFLEDFSFLAFLTASNAGLA